MIDKRYRHIFFNFLLFFCYSTHLFADENHAHEEQEKHEAKAPNLPSATVKSGFIYKSISLFGKIELHPAKSMHVHPKNSGVVKEVYRSIGDDVKAGVALARVEGNVGIESYNLVSAIDGTILDKQVTVGQAVNEETEAFTIADTKNLIASFVAYPRDFIHLKIGQPIYLQSRSKKTEPSSIFYISPILQDSTRTGQLLAAIDNHDNRWISGQYVMGRVFTDQKPVSGMLPLSFLKDPNQEKIKILIKTENTFSPMEIKLGERDFEHVEAIGLKDGDEYIAAEEQDTDHHSSKKEEHHDH